MISLGAWSVVADVVALKGLAEGFRSLPSDGRCGPSTEEGPSCPDGACGGLRVLCPLGLEGSTEGKLTTLGGHQTGNCGTFKDGACDCLP